MSHFETEYDRLFREFCTRCTHAWDLYAEGKLDEAIALAEAILQEEPKLPASHKAVLHMLLSKSTDSTKAVHHAQKAVSLYQYIINDTRGASWASDHAKFHNKINLRRAKGELQHLVDQRRLAALLMANTPDEDSESSAHSAQLESSTNSELSESSTHSEHSGSESEEPDNSDSSIKV